MWGIAKIQHRNAETKCLPDNDFRSIFEEKMFPFDSYCTAICWPSFLTNIRIIWQQCTKYSPAYWHTHNSQVGFITDIQANNINGSKGLYRAIGLPAKRCILIMLPKNPKCNYCAIYNLNIFAEYLNTYLCPALPLWPIGCLGASHKCPL